MVLLQVVEVGVVNVHWLEVQNVDLIARFDSELGHAGNGNWLRSREGNLPVVRSLVENHRFEEQFEPPPIVAEAFRQLLNQEENAHVFTSSLVLTLNASRRFNHCNLHPNLIYILKS